MGASQHSSLPLVILNVQYAVPTSQNNFFQCRHNLMLHFIGPWQCIQEVKAWLYHHWLLRCSLKYVRASAHFSGYINLKYAMVKVNPSCGTSVIFLRSRFILTVLKYELQTPYFPTKICTFELNERRWILYSLSNVILVDEKLSSFH